MKDWSVYLLECSDKSLYCGITNDLDRRVKEHNSGTGAKYTRGRRPIRLICSKKCPSKNQALKLEARIKKMRKTKKITGLMNVT